MDISERAATNDGAPSPSTQPTHTESFPLPAYPPFRRDKPWGEATSDALDIVRSVEVFLSLGIGVAGWLLPMLLPHSSNNNNNDIPYQILNDGEVIRDQRLNHAVQDQTVSTALLILLCIILPILLFLLVGVATGPRSDARAALCVFFVAFGLNALITDSLKVYCAMPRPNFYDLCGFDDDTLLCATDDAHALDEARRSFPSGHASLSFCGMSTVALFLLGKVGLYRCARSRLLGLLLVGPPLGLAFFIAASRVHDEWHHPADVVAGACIGTCCAVFVYGLW